MEKPTYEELQDEIVRLQTVCHAAADEIERVGDAHRDAEGYGPQTLLNALRGKSKTIYVQHLNLDQMQIYFANLKANYHGLE
jgi:hypothetical protein